MIKVLITGADGQLGNCLRDLALQEPILNVTYTDYRELDITNINEIKELFEKERYDYCINCAAYTAVDKAEEEVDRCFQINADGVKNLSVCCNEYGITLIQISTDFVFNGDQNIPYTTSHLPDPISVYGASKFKGEVYTREHLENYFIVRTSWVFSEYGANFVKTMLRLAAEKEELSVVDDQFGSPTYARDLAGFILHLIISGNRNFGVLHFSNTGITNWYLFAREIFRQSNTSISLHPIPSESYPTAAKRPKYSGLDLSQTIENFEITIRPWEESLQDCLSKLGKKKIKG